MSNQTATNKISMHNTSLCSVDLEVSKLGFHLPKRCSNRGGRGSRGNFAIHWEEANEASEALWHKKSVFPKSSLARGISKTFHVELISWRSSGNMWSSTAGTGFTSVRWGWNVSRRFWSCEASRLERDASDSLTCLTTKRCCNWASFAFTSTGTCICLKSSGFCIGSLQVDSLETKNSCAWKKVKPGSSNVNE